MRTDLRILRRALLLGAWSFANLPPAPGEDTGSEIARLRAEIQALDQKLRDLENRRASEEKTDACRQVFGRTIGLNWYLNHNVKCVLHGEHSDFDHDPARPTARVDEDVILTRVQLRF